jgi:UDP-N-acetylmuramate dehydrogenase
VEVRYDEPMKEHTTFKVGGPADAWLRPKGDGLVQFCGILLHRAKEANVPVFVLGGGANIVVADSGIRGIVLDTGAWKGVTVAAGDFIVKSGTTLDEAADTAAEMSLTGLEFFAGMPGTIGGAVFMNARCYGVEVADVLKSVVTVNYINDFDGELFIDRVPARKENFAYKVSPFQGKDYFILSAVFKLQGGDINEIKAKMEQYRKDRTDKGHYLFPCAGSAFKNNRLFGKPTGQIIDDLGLKGFTVGGAQIAPFHGNIVINTGSATASDIRSLMDEVKEKVKASAGFDLEAEIIFVG